MRRLVVLGAGTAGTMVANNLRRKLDPAIWQITVVDQDDQHLYQPGFLFIPFGIYQPSDVTKPRHRFIPDGVELVLDEIDSVDADADQVYLAAGARSDKSIFDFYSIDGATALAGALNGFEAGRLVVHVTDMPIKCPVAPLEFTFLAEAYFRIAACATGSS